MHAQVLEAVLEENKAHLVRIQAAYQEIATTLTTEATDCAELKALQDYTNKAAGVLAELYDQYIASCFERVKFLLNNKYKLNREDIDLLKGVFVWPSLIQNYLRKSFESQSQKKRALEEQLEEDQRRLENEINEIIKRVEIIAEAKDGGDYTFVKKTVQRSADIKKDIDIKQEKANEITEKEALLEVPHSDMQSRLQEVRENLDPLDRLWGTVKLFVDKTSQWLDLPIAEIDPEDAERSADELKRSFLKLSKEFGNMGDKRANAKRIADLYCNEMKDFIAQTIPLMLLICNPGMKERHWNDIESVTGLSIPKGEVLNIHMMHDIGLQHQLKEIEEICISANKEYSLQMGMEKMEVEWENMIFDTKEYRGTGTRILQGVDEIQQLLDDQIVKTQAMKGVRYIKPFIHQITRWEETLLSMQDILDNWLKVQATWLYLEPIFSSDDIMRQMPTEGKMFRAVDNTWRHSMAQTFAEPSCIKVARRQGFLESLIEANAKLEQIQKGLNDYLETKRLAFPRFFFLSNDELLEILAETKDPLRVQPHLKKCFDGIAQLHFMPNMDITACYDPKGEKVDFPYEKVNHKRINPNDSGGNVELWLIEVEAMMKKSLAYAVDMSMKDFTESDRIEWLQRWQGQVVICVNQTMWCFDIEKVLTDDVSGKALLAHYKKLCEELLRTVELVRGNISKALRTAIGALVVMDVHNRDTVFDMTEVGVKSKTDFDWISQLRYYWSNNGISAQTGKPATVKCNMINAMALYAYEYIGNQDRLVITPLTDRCYRTLMGAIHLNLGGAPEGPAGTGKTETTKDLAKAIAIQCVVTNCSDGLDYLAMAKFFKGLASSGAWACFDEFNRIQLEVLSVIAQQILQIQMAKLAGLERFVFEGTELDLKPTCCPFITMNPGYAGRAELPDNLKVLFRTVAMMVPDYAMISEIILYSYGYTTARPLSVKIVTTYKLCSEQLSSQSHYDYGMRAVIAVLRAAGNLKRSDGHLPEDVLVLRSIIDVNLPKFLSPDVPLFNGIVSDLFPGVKIDPPDTVNMRKAFNDICDRKGLINEEYFWEKVVQVYDMMVVRHGFMIVGMPFSGKSSAWKVLAEVLGLLAEKFPKDKRWSKVIPVMQNPKSITMGQLYGMFDPVSHEWTDGVLAINYRNAANNRVGIAPLTSCNPEDRKWILFDGPVDALWIENMNTVLDDNKKLCLMSGEIIAMTDVMSMMFEPMDLLVASPATVSRCGMIYMEPERLGWRPLLTSWMHTNRKGGKFNTRETEHVLFTLYDADVTHILSLFDWIVEPALCFVRKDNSEMSPTVDANLVMSLLNILEALLPKAFAKYRNASGAEEEVTESRQLKQRLQDIECCFFFALVWSIGKSGTAQSQTRFSKFLDDYLGNMNCLEADYGGVVNLLAIKGWKKPDLQVQAFKGTMSMPMPIRQSFYECAYIPAESKWKYWSDLLPQYQIKPGTSYSHIVVPNNYTGQFAYLLELLIPQKKHVLMCGPTGTGKSVYVNNIITQVLPQDKYKALCLGFSAKTSANMTQDIIDGKLDKRKKGVYGPPMGQQSVIFVDDLNMPEVETYGAQPPIELVRQLVDNGGWYDLKEKTWRQIIDTSLVAAMGPAGGGRNSVTPRLLRHFNLFCFAEFDDTTLRRIFSTIVQWHFNAYSFPSDVRAAGDSVVDATLDTYRAAMAVLLPTPQKSHYTFNLRDFSRIVQGVLLCKPSDSFNKGSLVRLWAHEALRVFGDRLTDDTDRKWFNKHLETMCTTRFSVGFYDTFKHLDTEVTKVVGVNEMRSLLFGDYMTSEDSKPYEEIRSMHDLHHRMEEFLGEYNAMSRKPMDLVMFGFAIEHISRVSRILKMPGGNALLVGVGGSGRQSVTRLATHMANYSLYQIEISKNYSNLEWREDLKNVLKSAGCTNVPVTFLFTDSQIKKETFVEDINNMLNNGEVPNIFPSDERAAICESVRPFAKQLYGKAASDMNAQELYSFFIGRVKQFLHIVLVFSPIGDAFRDRLRKFPALINCCTIDWFTAWPGDALVAVAQKFLSDVKFETEDTRSNIVTLCQTMHQDVINLSSSYLANLKRRNYVTPTSYLELIIAFKTNLDAKRIEVSQARMRYEVGLEKLAFAAEQLNHMQYVLGVVEPELMESAAAAEVLMGQIEQKMPSIQETRKVVSAEAEVAQREKDVVEKQKDEVKADLAEAIPALNEAIDALNTIKPNEINEIKALSKPPEKIRMVCRAVCVMLDIKPVRIPDPENPSKRIMDYWGPSQKMLADPGFIKLLFDYDKDNIPPRIVSEVKKDFMDHPDFKPEIIAKASQAAEGLCKWCCAMITYDRIAKIVAPKKAALEKAEHELAVMLAALEAKQAALKKVEDELKSLEDQLAAAKQKKLDLESQAGLCDKKIIRANQLLDGLGGERERWNEFAHQLGIRYKRLTGDVLVSAAVLAYLGPFTAVYRQRQLTDWVKATKESSIPCSDNPTLSNTLGDAVRIRQWNIDGLPTDGFSIDNGIIVFNARRWPLMIDPQGQANKWIRNMEKANNLQVVKLTGANYLRTLENSIQFGVPVLLENVGEELDPSLEPLLQKQLFKQGGVNCIRLGDSTVEYSENFRFYITTKLRNPHYLPEVSVKVTLLNFMITPEGLQDQLLGIVVSQERPDLEEQRNQLIIESAENKRLLKEIEDKILHIMGSSSGNILEDETAIETLKSSKVLSDEISSKQKIAEETEVNINLVRQSYSPVAYSSQILFFCITDLANIEPVYQYSLSWFINLFISSIVNSEKGRDVAKRLENLDAHFTYSLYRNVCRSLLEKDKLLFSFLLTTRIMGGQGKKDESEWFFLLTGGLGMDNHHPNPAPGWLPGKNWDAICRLSEVEKFQGFKEDFIANLSSWEAVYDSIYPQEEPFPGMFAEAEGLSRLCALRVIRTDKVVLAIQKFVSIQMGDKFIKPPPFDLQSCYSDSSAVVPLVFILSPGSDPMGAVQRAGQLLKTTVEPISLGQGQGPKAEKLIQKAKQKGTWVVLQNCHLAPSWMTTLEKYCEELDPDEVHPGFRLWCTTYPSEVFPVSVLQNGVKMTNEPPKGLRANLLGSFNADPIANDVAYNSCSKGFEFRRLVFGLCFFHALVQERRLYGPLGWNIPYEFNESDLRISVQQLILFLDENDFVPFKALIYTAGECNYGGRVTDDKDRRTLLCILRRFYAPEFLDDNHLISPSGQFRCPKDGPREDYMEYIDGFDLIASPEVFGLHDNATLTKDQNDTNNLLNSVIDTEGGGSGSSGGSGASKEDIIASVAADIAGKTPDNFDMEYAMLKYPVLWENSMNTVLCQELIRYNNLLSLMRESLSNVQKAIKGLVVMSSELEIFGNQLFINRIPALWKANNKSYPSLKPLSSYISDQQLRLQFFSEWLLTQPPPVFWISGFFFTQVCRQKHSVQFVSTHKQHKISRVSH
jgi:dynein heavy chain